MFNINITISRTLFKINAFRNFSEGRERSNSAPARNPIGIQSGLFSEEAVVEDKFLFERRQRNAPRPRMIVEQVAETKDSAILLPGMDQEKIFRPLWVTVPQKDLPAKTQIGMSAETLRSFADIRKFYSVLRTWLRFTELILSEKLASIKIVPSGVLRMSALGLQPALFDKVPLASMEKARYISGRDSFSSDEGVMKSSVWKPPTLKFVITVPAKKTENPLRPRSEQKATMSGQATRASFASISPLFPYLFGALALAAGICLNVFFLHY